MRIGILINPLDLRLRTSAGLIHGLHPDGHQALGQFHACDLLTQGHNIGVIAFYRTFGGIGIRTKRGIRTGYFIGRDRHTDSRAAHQYAAIIFAGSDGLSHIYGYIGVNWIVTAVIFTFISQLSQMFDDGLFKSCCVGISADCYFFHLCLS